MKIKAFTLMETLTVIVVIGILAAIMTSNLRPGETREKALLEGGKAMYLRLDAATRQIVSRHTENYRLDQIKDSSGKFTIASSENLTRLMNMYKKYLRPSSRNVITASTLAKDDNSTFFTRELITKSGAKIKSGLKVTSFTGYTLKNRSYIGFKMNNNCTTKETYIYSPYTPDEREVTNSCGLIFFDVNGAQNPNYIGIDQFIVSLKMSGIR